MIETLPKKYIENSTLNIKTCFKFQANFFSCIHEKMNCTIILLEVMTLWHRITIRSKCVENEN